LTYLTQAQLLKDCIPEGVFNFLGESDSIEHHHRSIIVNLACGASIRLKESRENLCKGYVHYRYMNGIPFNATYM
jgi:hypothetical protein